ncbi:MAG: type II restriction endonuclease [Promethearchaeota archaeon]
MDKKKLAHYFNCQTEDDLFKYIIDTITNNITTWSYFVNWDKVITNVKKHEVELNILNYLIGKNNIYHETLELAKKYPNIIKVFPALIAIRDKKLTILNDVRNFEYTEYDFSKDNYTDDELKLYVSSFLDSGFGNLLIKNKLKNFVDYLTGVEVGIDTNGRKNRTGDLMENIIEVFLKEMISSGLEFRYIRQATKIKMKEEWDIDVDTGDSARRIDFAVDKNGKLFFIEVNFYGGGGSKLKATAGEYKDISKFWSKQGITFIWITDGQGWKTTQAPLREFFDVADYLLNLNMVRLGILERVINEKD